VCRAVRGMAAQRASQAGTAGGRTALRPVPPGASARRDVPAVILSSPAVRVCPLALGHPDTPRVCIGRRSPRGAIAARHTGGRDAAWHGPQRSGAASEPTHHLLTWATRTSSRDVRGIRLPSPALDAAWFFGPPALLAHADTRVQGAAGVSPRVRRLAACVIPASLWPVLPAVAAPPGWSAAASPARCGRRGRRPGAARSGPRAACRG